MYMLWSTQYLITLFSSIATLSVISKVRKDSIFCHECQMVIKACLYPNHMKEAHNWSNCEICGLKLSEDKKIDHIQEFHSKAGNWKGLKCDYCTNGLKNDQLQTCLQILQWRIFRNSKSNFAYQTRTS